MHKSYHSKVFPKRTHRKTEQISKITAKLTKSTRTRYFNAQLVLLCPWGCGRACWGMYCDSACVRLTQVYQAMSARIAVVPAPACFIVPSTQAALLTAPTEQDSCRSLMCINATDGLTTPGERIVWCQTHTTREKTRIRRNRLLN